MVVAEGTAVRIEALLESINNLTVGSSARGVAANDPRSQFAQALIASHRSEQKFQEPPGAIFICLLKCAGRDPFSSTPPLLEKHIQITTDASYLVWSSEKRSY